MLLLGAVGEASTDIGLFEGGVVVEDLFDSRTAGQQVEDQRNRDSMTADAGHTGADLWIDADAGEQLFACRHGGLSVSLR